MTTKEGFVPPMVYQMFRDLFDLTLHYCTRVGTINVGRFPFPGEVRTARKGYSPETATRNEFGRTTKAQHN